MSLSGSTRREMALLGFSMRRGLDENEMRLSSGGTLTITLGPIDVELSDYGWDSWRSRLRRAPSRVGSTLYALGCSVGIERNAQDLSTRYLGDAAGLDPEEIELTRQRMAQSHEEQAPRIAGKLAEELGIFGASDIDPETLSGPASASLLARAMLERLADPELVGGLQPGVADLARHTAQCLLRVAEKAEVG